MVYQLLNKVWEELDFAFHHQTRTECMQLLMLANMAVCTEAMMPEKTGKALVTTADIGAGEVILQK